MKVLLFLPKGFEHMETGVFIDVIGWAREVCGDDIELAVGGFLKEVPSTFGVPIVASLLPGDIRAADYDALALPGGFEEYGYYDEAFDEWFLSLIREFNTAEKFIASICVGALPLGKSGILRGRRATTYHLDGGRRQKQLAEFGADVVQESVVVDGNVITSCCPETAIRVAFRLLEMMTGKGRTDRVRAATGYV